jgi:hypothetical protein
VRAPELVEVALGGGIERDAHGLHETQFSIVERHKKSPRRASMRRAAGRLVKATGAAATRGRGARTYAV